MAAKTPTTIRKESLGSLTLIIANFDGTVSSNDIDDNDTWATGITSIVGWPIVQSTIDGPQDCTIDAVGTDGTLTFASAANQTAYVYVLCRGM
jgi:hypothetical protein